MKQFIIWQTKRKKSSSPLQKFILPAYENIGQIKFKANQSLLYSGDEKHSPSEFYHPGKQMILIYTPESFINESIF